MWIRSLRPFETATHNVREEGVLIELEHATAQELIDNGDAVAVEHDEAMNERYRRGTPEKATADPQGVDQATKGAARRKPNAADSNPSAPGGSGDPLR